MLRIRINKNISGGVGGPVSPHQAGLLIGRRRAFSSPISPMEVALSGAKFRFFSPKRGGGRAAGWDRKHHFAAPPPPRLGSGQARLHNFNHSRVGNKERFVFALTGRPLSPVYHGSRRWVVLNRVLSGW